MCLAVPGRIVDVFEEHGLRMGHVDYDGATISACLAYVDEAGVGDYVLVHAGFAISALNEEEAQASLALWEEFAREDLEEGSS